MKYSTTRKLFLFASIVYKLQRYWQWGNGNIFLTIVMGILVLKGDHAKSRLAEVALCMEYVYGINNSNLTALSKIIFFYVLKTKQALTSVLG